MRATLLPIYEGSESSTKTLIGSFTGIFLLLLFPGFFLYHFATAKGIIPSFMGGWFGPVSLIGMPLFSLYLIFAVIKTRGTSVYYLTLYSMLVIYTGLWVGVHSLTGTMNQQSFLALENSGGILLYWIVLFTIGIYLDFERTWIYQGLILGFILMTVLTFMSVNPSSMVLDLGGYQNIGANIASYQGLARSYLVTTILLLSLTRRLVRQLLIIIIGSITLFFIGARSEFFGFLLIGFVWLLGLFWKRGITVKNLATIILLSILLSLLLTGVSGSRQFQAFDLASSNSWKMRIAHLQQGWESIKHSPLFGDYAGQISIGGIGSYIHNGLSAWRQFGLIGFILFCSLSMVSFMAALGANIRQRFSDPNVNAAIYTNVLCVALILVTKSVFWVLPPFAWGLTARVLLEKKDVL